MTLAAIIVLATATFALRIAGPLLRGRVRFPEAVDDWVNRATTVLLVAVVATATLMADGELAGWALPCGVAVGAVAAWRKAPFILVVVLAAATTAGLRLAGLS